MSDVVITVVHFTWNASPFAIRGLLQVGGSACWVTWKSLGAFLHVLFLINVPGGMTSFPKRSPPRLQSQSNSKQALALCYSTMIPLWIVEVFEQENECLLVFLVTHSTVILLHSRNRKTHLSMFDRLWQTHQYKKICMKEMTQGCDLSVFSDPLYVTQYWMYYYKNKNYY